MFIQTPGGARKHVAAAALLRSPDAPPLRDNHQNAMQCLQVDRSSTNIQIRSSGLNFNYMMRSHRAASAKTGAGSSVKIQKKASSCVEDWEPG